MRAARDPRVVARQTARRSLESDGFDVEVVASGAPSVWTDPAALEQALVNLLDYAVK